MERSTQGESTDETQFVSPAPDLAKGGGSAPPLWSDGSRNGNGKGNGKGATVAPPLNGHANEPGAGIGSATGSEAAGTARPGPETEVRPASATVSVILPVRNEADNLPHVLPLIPSWVDEIIIVDGRSDDDTVNVARSICPRARVIEQDGDGKGNAIACGLREVTSDITVLLDGDGSTDPREIPRFVVALTSGYDMAKGTRFVTGGGSEDITTIRRIGNRLLTGLVNRVFGVRYSDLCYGYNAFWTRCVPPAVTDCSGFEVETLMNIRLAVAHNKRVVEVPSFERHRRAGRSNLRARRDGLRVLRTIVAEWIRPR